MSEDDANVFRVKVNVKRGRKADHAQTTGAEPASVEPPLPRRSLMEALKEVQAEPVPAADRRPRKRRKAAKPSAPDIAEPLAAREPLFHPSEVEEAEVEIVHLGSTDKGRGG